MRLILYVLCGVYALFGLTACAQIGLVRPIPSPHLNENQVPFYQYFQGIQGTFVLYDEQDGRYMIYNEPRAYQRFSPWSTFEIAAALMIIDSGQISSVDRKIPWNPALYPANPSLSPTLRAQWEKDHSLRSAYQEYALWVFQSQIKRLPMSTISRYLKTFHYGNSESKEENFWLGQSLTISAMEQINFLRGLINKYFPISISTREQIIPMLVTERFSTDEKAQNLLVMKTGSGVFATRKAFGWSIGYVEKNNRRYYFAMNLEMDDYTLLSEKREKITLGVLSSLGLIPLNFVK